MVREIAFQLRITYNVYYYVLLYGRLEKYHSAKYKITTKTGFMQVRVRAHVSVTSIYANHLFESV